MCPRRQLLRLSKPRVRSFFEHLLQRRCIEHRLSEQLLQSAVLVLQRFQLAGIGDLHPARGRTPFADVASLMPYLRHTSPADRPAAFSFSALMICSSVSLLLHTYAYPSPEGTDPTQKRGNLREAGQVDHSLGANISSW
jgi:hypothetical protein